MKNEWWLIPIYVGFFGLIGFAVYWTESAWCLWALLLTPRYKIKPIKKNQRAAILKIAQCRGQCDFQRTSFKFHLQNLVSPIAGDAGSPKYKLVENRITP